jgi:hypothetical protein
MTSYRTENDKNVSSMRSNHSEEMDRIKAENEYALADKIKKKFDPFKKQYDELRETVEELEQKYNAAIQEREDDTEHHVAAVKKAFKEEERKNTVKVQEMQTKMEEMQRNSAKVSHR